MHSKNFTPLLSLFLLLILGSSGLLLAQNDSSSSPLWQSIEEVDILLTEAQERQIIPQKYETMQLNETQLQSILANAPMRFSAVASSVDVLLELPLPDGTFQQFNIQEAPVMHPNLGARYPDMKSYWGKGVDDPTAYLRFDVTPNGFHGMVLSGKNGTAYIDPYAKGDTEHYISYYKKDYFKENATPFVCGVEGTEIELGNNSNPPVIEAVGDCKLRTYRLALACVGEYAQFHGGTVAGAMAAMVTSMTRINGIYERDLAVTMVMVENNDQLIFLNPNTDPYSNSSGDLGANQTTCTNVIGTQNFDIGHLLTTSGGGVAMLNSPCVNNLKARGLSGQGAPVGDPYDVDYVAHEMGHQFGGNHTQNNSCNRNGQTAMEPGSASTIMGYAGICTPNVQNNSDDHFHAVNLAEMATNITVGNSSTCPTITDTGNLPPVIDAAQNYFVPVLTPFTLTASATDPDSDNLTYCWEQMDNQVAPMPPQSTSTSGPAFRSNSPVSSPERNFPNIEDLVNNIDPEWEELPSVTRNMRFRCTVRDNFMGAGCTDETNTQIMFRASAGPFLVLKPNTAVTWLVGDFAEVNWDVANTDAAPISCSEVDILLSTDGGLTYPIVLAENVANNGSILLEVPDHVGENNRVKVVCSDNIFFDISNTDFIIEAPTEPGIAIYVDPPNQIFCANTDPITMNVSINSLAGFNEMVTVTLDGVPNEADVTYTPAGPFTPPGIVAITINNPAALPGGTSAMVNVNGGTASAAISAGLNVFPNIPAATQLSTPANNAVDVLREPTLTWAANDFTDIYTIEIATNPSFDSGSIIITETVEGTSYEPAGLQYYTVYYWRVRSSNICGESIDDALFSFQTLNSGCEIIESTDIPLIIPSSNIGVFESTIEIPDDRNILDFNLRMSISHLSVDDLLGELKTPNGEKYTLFNQTDDCNVANLTLLFDDAATKTAEDFTDNCSSGSFQPADPFSIFLDTNAKGTWTLAISDISFSTGGQVNSWSIEICSDATPLPNISLINQVLAVMKGSNETITDTYLKATTNGVSESILTYTITSLPSNGTLAVNGMPVAVGSTFTQSDIDNNLLLYTHDDSDTNNDAFNFEVLNDEGTWSNDHTFNIVVFDQALSAVPFIEVGVACEGEANGQINIDAFGGMPPYQYSLNGVDFQNNNDFSGLSAGMYSFTVEDATGMSFSTMTELVDPEMISATAIVEGNQVTINGAGGTGGFVYGLQGEPSQSSNVFTGLEIGDYTAYVQDENGCETTVDFTILITSTEDVENELLFEINPNPNNGSFVLRLLQDTGNEVDVNIYDMVGKRVYNRRYGNYGNRLVQSIDLNHLSSGVYVLNVSSATNFGSKRVILVK